MNELVALHEPWVTSNASEVLEVIESHGGQMFLDVEGLIVVEIDDGRLEQLNGELAAQGCKLSNDMLHTL